MPEKINISYLCPENSLEMNKHRNIDIQCYRARGKAPFLREHHLALCQVEVHSTDLRGGICPFEDRGGSTSVTNRRYAHLMVLNDTIFQE